MPIENTEGISGSEKICTLRPYEVLGFKDKPIDPPKNPEESIFIKIINWIKNLIKGILNIFTNGK